MIDCIKAHHILFSQKHWKLNASHNTTYSCNLLNEKVVLLMDISQLSRVLSRVFFLIKSQFSGNLKKSYEGTYGRKEHNNVLGRWNVLSTTLLKLYGAMNGHY